jgi:hypothetical protein
VNEESNLALAIWDAVIYSGTSFGGIAAIMAMMNLTKNKKQVKSAIYAGIVLNVVIFILLSAGLLAFYPMIFYNSIPILTSLDSIFGKVSIFVILYQVLVCFALLTSLNSMGIGLTERYIKYGSKIISNQVVRRGAILIIVLGIGTFIASAGLVRSIAIGLRVRSFFNLPIMLFAIIAGPRRIRELKVQYEENQ